MMHGNEKHGATVGGKKSPEYVSYCNMLQRCYYPKHNRFYCYGGRGIRVCERWLGREGFVNFLADLGFKPVGKRISIEREDVDGNYEPSNCRWATPKEQSRNTRVSRKVEYNGHTALLVELCDAHGVPYDRVAYRIDKLGMSVHEALTTPNFINPTKFAIGDGRPRGRQ